MIDYWLYQMGIFLTSLLPRSASYCLADLFGFAAYYLLRRKRAILRSNLEMVLSGERLKDKVLRKVFYNYAHYYATLFQFFRLKDEDIAYLVEVKGEEWLEEALKAGRGVILITSHLGHWDLGGAALARRFKVNVVAEKLPSERLFNLFTRFRTHQGMKVIAGAKALRRLYVALKCNEVVIILGDRDMDGRGILLPFFGRATTMPKGAAVLARTTGAIVLSGFIVKEEGKEHYTCFVEEEIPISKTNDKKSDLELNTSRIVKVIEDQIRRYPDNWYMFQPIWK